MLLSSLTFACYALALVGVLWRTIPQALTLLAWISGCALHGWLLLQPIGGVSGFLFSFVNALILTAWLINALVVLWAPFRATLHLGIVTLPCALVAVWVEPALSQSEAGIQLGVYTHILLSLTAYGVLMLGGIQALMLLLKEYALVPRHLVSRLSGHLSPLDQMESLLIEIIALGLILLSAGLGVGGIVLDNLFTPGILHKTTFSFLSWITLVALLWGHWRFGWRGRFAAGITLTGLVLLILGFLGSKLALEIILGGPA